MLCDIFATKIFEGADITLLDINPKALNDVYKYTIDFIKEKKLNFNIDSTTDRKKLL